jgi:hypothetical protein
LNALRKSKNNTSAREVKALNSVSRAIVKSFALTLAVCAGLYLIGDKFGLIPDSLKDFVHWFMAEINLWAFLACFAVSAYVLNSYLKSRARRR